MGKTFNMVGGGSSTTQDLPIGSTITVTSDNGATIDITKGSLHYQKIIGRLPSAYQEVEYLYDNSGNAYINTEYYYTSESSIAVVGKYEVASNTLFGVVDSTTGLNLTLTGQQYRYYDSGSISTTWDNTNFHEYKFDKNMMYEDDVFRGTYTKYSSYTFSYPMFLFRRNYSSSPDVSKATIKSAKIWEDGVLVRDFVPCYRISDSVAGMYDIVNDVFYTNAGSGTFTVGADVATGTATFTVHSSGRWTVTANKTGETEITNTVDVLADDTDYPIDMFWRLYLYEEGNEYASVTGGWEYVRFLSWASDGTLNKNADNIQMYCAGGATRVCGCTTANQINLNRYSKLCFNITSYQKSGTGYMNMTIESSKGSTSFTSSFSISNIGEYSVDISSISNNQYLAFYVSSQPESGNIILSFDKVWLE